MTTRRYLNDYIGNLHPEKRHFIGSDKTYVLTSSWFNLRPEIHACVKDIRICRWNSRLSKIWETYQLITQISSSRTEISKKCNRYFSQSRQITLALRNGLALQLTTERKQNFFKFHSAEMISVHDSRRTIKNFGCMFFAFRTSIVPYRNA